MNMDSVHYQEVVRLAHSGRITEARKLLAKILPETREHDLVCNVGVCLWQMNRYEMAEMCYRRALQIEEVPAIWFNLAITLDDLDRRDEAKKALASFLRVVDNTGESRAAMEMLAQNGKTHLVAWARKQSRNHRPGGKATTIPLPSLEVMFYPRKRRLSSTSQESKLDDGVINIYSSQSAATKTFPETSIRRTKHARRTLRRWAKDYGESALLNDKFIVKPFQLIGPPTLEFICADHAGYRYFLQNDGSWEKAAVSKEIIPYPWRE